MKNIDDTLFSLYKKKKYGELAALYGLFNPKLARAIKNEVADIKGKKNNPYYFEKIYVDFQWIDKIPLADFTGEETDINDNLIENKTELGDIFIQYRNSLISLVNGIEKAHYVRHNAIVIQAKISDSDHPKVPIGYINSKKANSTSKELKLLQDWPEFNLYETSKSSTPLAKNILVKKVKNHFHFMAVSITPQKNGHLEKLK